MTRGSISVVPLLGLAGGSLALAAGLILVSLLATLTGDCGAGGAVPTAAIAVGPAGAGTLAGATEYGGPGDPGSGVVGSSGENLLAHPDSYAELGGTSFATATMLGGLPYMTPLRISWQGHSAVARKRDIGLGGGPVDGRSRVIDLWWRFAVALGIPYAGGRWSGVVRLERTPPTGAAGVLDASPLDALASGAPGAQGPAGSASDICPGLPVAGAPVAGVPLTSARRAQLLPDGRAAAPAAAPAPVAAMIAAGNAIAGRPYSYGAAHGVPLSYLAPAYDCSSSVEHLLYGAALVPVTDGESSSGLMAFGLPGPGRWVTLYANPDHVFMYVAGLRWDTWNAAGPTDGGSGIGWHPLIRDASGFVARHPAGL